MFVYILNCHGQPIMPCQPRKARLLLKAGEAKVVKMVPFTLQLLYGSSGYKQEVALGIDAGTKQIGVSATTERAVLFEAEVQPRTDIQELLATRRQFRRARRNRKTRYRPRRFSNRKRPKGWLAPSVQHRVDAHLKTIQMVHRLFESRKTGGDRLDNLITLCETCHDHLHRTHQEHQIRQRRGGFRDATQMGIIRWSIYEQAQSLFPRVHLTYGYLTKHIRITNQLAKS